MTAEKLSIVRRCGSRRNHGTNASSDDRAGDTVGPSELPATRTCAVPPASTSPLELPSLVLDTNVVLDWLLFRNTACDTLNAALVAGDVRWIATAAMREELAHVLARGSLAKWRPDLTALWARWDQHCTEVPAAPALGPSAALRCSDPDDQKFIDLAVTCKARWLLSHDRAVQRLTRRLRERGVTVTTPAAWLIPIAAV